MFVDAVFRKHGIAFQNNGLRARGPIIADGGIISNLGIGDVYFVDPTNGSDNRNGKSPADAFATLAYAYSKLTADQNDVLVYIPGTTALSIVDTLEWAKSYTHFIGLGAPTRFANRARIFNSGNSSASTPLLKVSASGCIFENLYIFQGSAVATVGCVEVSGGRNFFNNIHFAAPGHATMAGGVNSYALKLSAAEENTFFNCVVGVDTIKRTAATKQLWISGDCKRNMFDGCIFLSFSDTAAQPIVAWAGGQDRFTWFNDCLFYNFSTNHSITLTEAFDVTITTTHDIIMTGNCCLVGIDEWDAGDVTGTWIGSPAPAAATSGIAVKPAT